MQEERTSRIIDLQAEFTALRGAVRILLHNTYNADESALASLLDPCQPDSDEASRLANPAPTRTRSSSIFT